MLGRTSKDLSILVRTTPHIDVMDLKYTKSDFSHYVLPLGIIKLKNGDKVTVNLSLKDFQQAQKDGNVPGGWTPEMKLVSNNFKMLSAEVVCCK